MNGRNYNYEDWEHDAYHNDNITDYWKTLDGRVIKIEKLDDRHLLNIIKYLERKLVDFDRMLEAGLDVNIGLLKNRTLSYEKIKTEANRRCLPYQDWCYKCQQFWKPPHHCVDIETANREGFFIIDMDG